MSPLAIPEFKNLLAVAVIICAPNAGHAQWMSSAAANDFVVRIITTTAEGAKVWAEVKQKQLDGTATDVSYIRHEKGLAEIYVTSCNPKLYFNAYTENIGVHNPPGERWLPCTRPEVKFDDFKLMTASTLYSNLKFSDAVTWRSAFGGFASENSLPEEFAQALANKEYGRVAIISTELKEQFAKVGKVDEANFFYGVAIDAGARGAAVKLGLPFDGDNVTTYAHAGDRLELTEEAERWFTEYQMRDLGIPADASNIGKLDWQTMRSLPGGGTANVELYQVKPEALLGFETDDFTNLKPDM